MVKIGSAGTDNRVVRSTSMPIYHFNVYSDVEVVDVEGLECADLEVARARAVEGARSLMCEGLMKSGIDP